MTVKKAMKQQSATKSSKVAASSSKLKIALQESAERAGCSVEELETVALQGRYPPIDRLDGSLKELQCCRKLSLSTNAIDKLTGLHRLPKLEILSVGRNCIKKLDGIECLADTLTELWISYNQLEKLSGIENCKKLKVLYVSNNRIKDWTEIDRLGSLPKLEDLLLIGNPLYNKHRDAGTLKDYQKEILKRLHSLKKLDGEIVRADNQEIAKATE